ncbi:hypothetical protein BZA70DRAFT_82396 [Myxozyma melibiosi]|uniref:Uncharacterized protein n=1 Tax=Myxozyma melibiosi TaxID=54550 RepID=A0ABR1F230_9ASCO
MAFSPSSSFIRKSIFVHLRAYFRGRRLFTILVVALLSLVSLSVYSSSSRNAGFRSSSRGRGRFSSSHFLSKSNDLSTPASDPAPMNNYIPSSSWETPFSFSVSTADSDVAVIPQQLDRCPIYSFFDEAEFAALGVNVTIERAVLERWKRAIWAYGFMPVVLTTEDSKKNPRFNELEAIPSLRAHKKIDTLKYLAWSTAPTGILANHRIFPFTTKPNQNELKHLRECQFGLLTVYKDLGSDFVTGANKAVDEFVANAFTTGHRGNIAGYVDEIVIVEPKIGVFVHYTEEFVESTYKNMPPELLPDVINAHMHNNWLSRFSDGIEIVEPFPSTDRILHYPALSTAYALTVCPPEELEQFCPPGKEKCYKCNSNLPSGFIKFAEVIGRTKSAFKFVTVPHPLTHLALTYSTANPLSADFVRRKTTRDAFTKAVTDEIVEEGVGAPDRMLELKKLAAANYEVLDDQYYAIWEAQLDMSPACALDNYFEWALGFSFGGVLRNSGSSQADDDDAETSTSTTPGKSSVDSPASPFSVLSIQLDQCLPASEAKQLHKDAEAIGRPSRNGVPPPLQPTKDVINAARNGVLSTTAAMKRTRKMIEGWNLADAELWRFVRAMNERASQEPAVWLT